jgi:hypothetical protein
MSNSLKQDQRAGDHSLNVQGQVVHIEQQIHQGLTPEQARSELIALFEENFYRLQSVARQTAEERAGEITEKFLDELKHRNPAGLEAAQDVDMQAAIFDAQKAYARTGDKDLSDLLVDILVDRAGEKDRNLKQIVLNEALSVAPKLTVEQFDILSLVFLLRYSKLTNLRGLESLREYLENTVVPFTSSMPQHESPYQHLEYTGCASIQIDAIPVADTITATCPGIFPSPSTEEEICTTLCRMSPEISGLVLGWDSSTLKHLTLTSVGIAIAIANIRRKTGQEFDLGQWIK